MKILITGGAGFIGSAVVRHIIKNTQDTVVNIDKLTYAGNLESLSDISESNRYNFEHADICDSAEITRIFEQYQPDAVMHLAAESHVDRSITGPAAFIETNIVGTYALLEVARKYWSALAKIKKIIFVFIIFPLMKFTAIYRILMKLKTALRCRYLLKRRHMRQVAPILRQKHPAII